jgi:hypothetical protein
VRGADEGLAVVEAAVAPDEVVARLAEAVLGQEGLSADSVELRERGQHVGHRHVDQRHAVTPVGWWE